MKKIRFLLLMLLCYALVTQLDATGESPFFDRVYAADDTAVKSGWNTDAGSYYYYVNGHKVKGWKKIDGKEYYFHKKSGKLQKNKIVGDTSKKKFYVDQQGVKVTDKVIKQAVKFVGKHTKSGWSRSRKLKACYNYLWRNCKYQRAYDRESRSRMSSYAAYMFKNKKGNCYRGASAFAYVARVLGYESRVAVGGVSSRSRGTLSLHGWTEIKIGGKWYMFDISMQRASSAPSLYKLTSRKYPYRFRCDVRYTLSVNQGKVKWI